MQRGRAAGTRSIRRENRGLLAISAAVAAALAAGRSSLAVDYVWDNGTADFSWTTPDNWDLNNAAFPNANADTATFTGPTGAGIVSLNGNHTVGALTFGGTGGFTLAPGSGTSLTISNGAGGGTLTHAAGGTDTISAQLLAGGATINVSAGTLNLTNASLANANVLTGTTVQVVAAATLNAAFGGARPASPGASGSSALGAATVQLNGGTLLLTGADYDGGTGGLTGQYYVQQVRRNAQIEFRTLSGVTALFNTSTPETTTGGFTNTVGTVDYGNASYGTGAPFNAAGGTGAPNPGLTATDNVMATWRGQFVAPAAGTYTFGGNSDDGLLVFVDGQLVLNRPNFTGFTANPPAGTINLAAGRHDVFVAYYEGDGGAGVRVYENDPATEAAGDPLDLADLVAAQPQTSLGNNVNWTASSTIAAGNTYGVTLGTLTASTPGTTLTTGRVPLTGQGSPDGLVRFGATTFAASGTYTFDALSDVALGTLGDGTSTVTVTKTGPGNLILDSTATAPDTGGTTFDVQAGRLVVQRTNTGNNPLGTATVQLNGANAVLQLNTPDNVGGNVTFDNAVQVNQDARIEFMNHNTTARELILGSATRGIAIADGRTLEIASTNAANARTSGVISGDNANVRVSSAGDPGQQQGFLLMNAANTFGGRFTVENGANVRLDHADALKTQSLIDLQAGGRIEYFANNAVAANSPPVYSRVGSLFRLNAASNPSTIIGGGNLDVGTGRLLEFQTGNPFTGAGAVRHAAGAVYANSAGNLVVFPAATTTVGLRASDTRPLDLFRVSANLNGAGDGVVNAGWGATVPGFVMQVFGADRNLTNAAIQELNGQIIINDATSRTMQDGQRLDVNALGGTIAGSAGTALTVADNLLTTAASGKLTIGAHVPIDTRFYNGTVVFSHGTAGDFTGTTAGAADAVSIVNASTLEGRVSATGASALGGDAATAIGVALDRGTLRATQPGTAVSGAFLNVGKVFATGAGTLHVSRNAGAAGTVTEMRVNAAIDRSAGATLGLLSQNNLLGADERVRFATPAQAPARVGSVNMVAPWVANVSGNVGSFVDYDPSQDATTGVGFTNATYTTVPDDAGLAAATASTIADVTSAVTLGGPRTVGAVRVQNSLSGAQTLTVDTGGVIITTGAAVNHTIAPNLAAPAGTELVVYAGGATGGLHTINGTLTSDAGLTKWGPRTLVLGGNNAATLAGNVTINEGDVLFNNDNRLGAAANDVVLNGGGLRPQADMTLARAVTVNNGGGRLVNDGNRSLNYAGPITGDGALTVSSANGNNGVNRFQQPVGTPNTFAGGLIVTNGVLEFSRDDQLGAAPSAADYDRGHVAIVESAGSLATLRLASGAGAVTAAGRLVTLGGAARVDVPGASDSLTLDSPVRGSGSLNKLGAGTLVLASTAAGNGYTGATTVSAGSLLVDSPVFSGTGTGAVSITSGATLGGRGLVEGAITAATGSIVSPGLPGVDGGAGDLRTQGNLSLANDANFDWTLAAETTAGPGVNFDRLTVEIGSLTITAGANVRPNFEPGAEPSADAFWSAPQTWPDVIRVAGLGTLGTVGTLDINNTAWSEFGAFSTVSDGSGVDVVWTPVPEPGAASALGIAAGGLLLGRRRRRR